MAQLYRAHAGRLFAQVLLPRLGDRAAAEDALAETFRSAFEHLPKYEDRGSGLYPWLSVIARNKAYDLARSRGRSARALERLERSLAPITEPSEGPDSGIDRERLRLRVQRALDGIPPRYQEAIRLRLLEEREREECALRLDVRIGTFDVLLLRALRSFRKSFERSSTGAEEGS